MTRIIALAGVAALLSGTVAFAQAPPPGGPRPGPEAGAPPPPPGDPRHGPGPDGPPPPPPPPPTPPSRAAHIVLERGDARVDVKCADDDTTKACADVTLQMLEKLRTFRP